MVKVAIAGATSEVGREILDALVNTGKHEILVLGRGDPSKHPVLPGVTWKQTAFEDCSELATLLRGTHTLLCFWDPTKDPDAETQKRLVDAAIDAGVQRYAPSEWSTGEKLADCLDVFPFYADKVKMRQYLREINKNKKVIEYTLFQNGIFMEYLGYPKKTTTHLSMMPTLAMFSDNRIIGLQHHLDDKLTFTSIRDIANVVAAAVDYEGEWPEIGGISGDEVSLRQVQEIGETLKGTKFRVDALDKSDVETGEIKLDDLPPIAHPSIPEEQKAKISRIAARGLLLSAVEGAWTVTSEWNKRLPGYEFTSVQEFANRWATN